MKKTNLFVAGIAVVASLATVVRANSTATFYLDARSDYNDIIDPLGGPGGGAGGYANEPCSGGGGPSKGDGQLIMICPKMPNNVHIAGAYDASQADAYLYLDYSAAAGVVLSSVGLNGSIAGDPNSGVSGTADHLDLLSGTTTIYTANADVSNGPPNGPTVDTAWSPSGTAGSMTLAPGGAAGSFSLKMVKVPVTGAGAFDTVTGIRNGNGYRLAKLHFQANDRDCVGGHYYTSNRGVKLSVNSLLITNVNAGGTAGAVDVKLGYAGCVAEVGSNGAGNGSVSGTTSTVDDATISVREKGDFNDDGFVDNIDNFFFFNARDASSFGNANHLDTWLCDMNGDGFGDNIDNFFFFNFRDESSLCN